MVPDEDILLLGLYYLRFIQYRLYDLYYNQLTTTAV